MKRVARLALGLLAVLTLRAEAADAPQNPADYVAGRYQRQGEDFAIDIKVEGTTGVKFEGLHGDWTGTFEKATDDKPAKLIFRRKPSAQEMSETAPLWARQMVQGQLEWRLELEVAECPDFMLVGKWYPGELKWREGGGQREASVSGDGKPIDVEYDRTERESERWAEVNYAPALRIVPPDHPLANGDLPSVVKQQPFLPVVRLGPTLAEKAGDALTLNLRSDSGRAASVTVKRYGGKKAIPVVYMPDTPVIIDDHVGAFLPETLGGKISKETVRFEVKNGETVTAEYGGSTVKFKVFNSWVQQGISNHSENFARLEKFYDMLIADNVSTPQLKEVAYQKKRLIGDFQKLMAYQPQGDENFTDYTRIEIAEAYSKLIGTSLVGPGDHPLPTLQGPPPDKYGVSYLLPQERAAVAQAVVAGQQRYRDAFAGLRNELAIGLYDFIAMQTGAAQFVAVVWGIDTHGNRVDVTDRIFAGIGLGSQLLLVGANAASEIEALHEETALGSKGGKSVAEPAEAASAESDHQVGRAMTRPGETTPVGQAGSRANFLRVVRRGDEAALNQAYQLHALSDRDLRWRPLTANDPDFSIPVKTEPMNTKGTPAQIGNGACGIAVGEGIARDEGFVLRDEKASVTEALDNGNFEPIEVRSNRPNFRGGGMYDKQLAAYLEAQGAKTRVIRATNNTPVFKAMTEGLRKGKKYALLVNVGSDSKPAWHWIRFEGFSCSSGKAFAHVGDPWVGESLKMPTKMLRGRIESVVEADFADFHKMMQ